MNINVEAYKLLADTINPHKNNQVKEGFIDGYVEGNQNRYEGFINSLFNSIGVIYNI